ncbi:MAG: formate dehydrogenase subunit gamma [Hyphomicrobiales bacterium]|nr:formate dehydrogenase subunit gamma [Hyphomicrobiales bacterium]
MTMERNDTEIATRTLSVVEEWREAEGPLLPILNGVQKEFGYVPDEALPVIANALNLSRADVYGVVSFYHDYREHPAGRHVLKVCRAESCQAMGGDEMADRLREALGVDWHETSKDGAVTLEPVYCLGLCACSPTAMLDGEVIGRLDEERIGAIAAEVRA